MSTVALPHTINVGDPLNPTPINENFEALRDGVNNIEDANVSATAAIQESKILFDDTGHDHSGGSNGNPIPTAGIEDSAVTSVKIADGAVTDAKLADAKLSLASGGTVSGQVVLQHGNTSLSGYETSAVLGKEAHVFYGPANRSIVFKINANDDGDVFAILATQADGTTASVFEVSRSGIMIANDGSGSGLDADKVDGKEWVLVQNSSTSVSGGATKAVIIQSGAATHRQYMFSVYIPDGGDVTQGYEETATCAWIVRNATGDDVLWIQNTGSDATFYYKVWEWK